VDAANLLVKAGYAEAATPFLENCVRTNPYPDLRSRCTVGLAAANPAQAMILLSSLLDRKNPEEVINTSLRLMGDLAGTEDCPAEQKEAAIKELLARTQGMMNTLYYEAAIDGLERTRDPRAVEAIRKLTGSTKGTEVSRAAKRALALTFKDPAAIEGLRKDAKGGMMKTDDDKFFGGMVLIKAQDAAGFAYAQDQLAKKKGGFFSSNKGADYRPALVDLLVEYGGPQGVAPLQAGLAVQKPDEWLRAYIAIGLLELGDKTGIEDVRRALANTNWTHTRVRAAEAMAKQGDASGVPVLKAMAQDPGLLKKAADVFTGKDIDYEAMRIVIARALGRMNIPDAVPVLATLVADKSADVRVAAAYALANMTDPAALDAYPAALAQDYGRDADRLRSPDVAAHVLRTAVARFPQEARTRSLLELAVKSEAATVRFLALAASRP
jgi:HEAT repeat protein